MEDEKTTTETQVEEAPVVSPFGTSAWTETAPEVKTEQVIEAVKTEEKPVVEEIPVPKEWLKKEFDVDDYSVLKAEREELKTLKANPPATGEVKFENAQSKQIYELLKEGKGKEVRQFLETQEKIDSYVSAEVTNDTAADIIKLGMQLKYKDLSAKEIDYKFNKEFGIPREPMRRDDELDEEYDTRKAEWQEKVGDVEMNRNIEAKLLKPELEKAKAQLVLPEISKPVVQANEPTQEQLDNITKARENFLQTLESNYSKVEGFTTKVKDESVEIPISFKIPDEDKVAIKGRLQQGLDVNDFMDKRWFDDKGNAKVDQIITDLYQLENLDKILSGVANKSASQRLIEHRKQVSNININGNGFQETFNNQNGGNNTSPFAKDAWSEKPPLINN